MIVWLIARPIARRASGHLDLASGPGAFVEPRDRAASTLVGETPRMPSE